MGSEIFISIIPQMSVCLFMVFCDRPRQPHRMVHRMTLPVFLHLCWSQPSNPSAEPSSQAAAGTGISVKVYWKPNGVPGAPRKNSDCSVTIRADAVSMTLT